MMVGLYSFAILLAYGLVALCLKGRANLVAGGFALLGTVYAPGALDLHFASYGEQFFYYLMGATAAGISVVLYLHDILRKPRQPEATVVPLPKKEPAPPDPLREPLHKVA